MSASAYTVVLTRNGLGLGYHLFLRCGDSCARDREPLKDCSSCLDGLTRCDAAVRHAFGDAVRALLTTKSAALPCPVAAPQDRSAANVLRAKVEAARQQWPTEGGVSDAPVHVPEPAPAESSAERLVVEHLQPPRKVPAAPALRRSSRQRRPRAAASDAGARPRRKRPRSAAVPKQQSAPVAPVHGRPAAAVVSAPSPAAHSVPSLPSTDSDSERLPKRTCARLTRYCLSHIIERAEQWLSLAPRDIAAFKSWKQRRYLASSGYAVAYILYDADPKAAEEAHRTGVERARSCIDDSSFQRSRVYTEFRERARRMALDVRVIRAVQIYRQRHPEAPAEPHG